MIESDPIHGDKVAHGLLLLVVGVIGRDCLDVVAEVVEGTVDASVKSLGDADEHRLGLPHDLLDRVMVIVLVGDETDVRGSLVADARVRVDEEDPPLVAGDAEGSVALVEKRSHPWTPFFAYKAMPCPKYASLHS